ncbi:amino acid transporter-like protein [Dendryphion nanum]|uniref:Amino acid transporter-like protein n=1 Tax=Dendryphion nanum TaxID=256645 RepID=A0A9P9E421_9PLEO|nr:amino acid transporter-like protein [Dendryphion nanum]
MYLGTSCKSFKPGLPLTCRNYLKSAIGPGSHVALCRTQLPISSFCEKMSDHKQDINRGAVIGLDIVLDSDERELAKVGKKGVLRRNFAFFSILGFSCTLIITWEGMLSVFVFGLFNGGPGGLIYGFLFVWLGYAAVVASMGELVSMWPTAGGQYHWTSRLASERYKNVLSYVTGWQSVIAWQALCASAGYLTATAIQGVIINSQRSYVPERWHGTLLVFAIMLLCFIFNTILAKQLPIVENIVLIWHVTLFIVILAVLATLSPQKSASADVWKLFLNEGGYESKGLSFFVGLITPVFAFSGVDGAVHMSEEIKNSSRILPWAMLGSIGVNGIMGFSMLITILYCIGDIENALNTPTGFPFIEILTQGTSSVTGGTVLSALIVTMFAHATMNVVASTSRQLWAFSRDNAVPFASVISHIHPTMKIPLVSICITTTTTCLLSLINIGSATVFNAIVSLTVAGFFGSYILPFSLLLYARIYQPEKLQFGPWRLGKMGVWINGFAILFSIIVMFFSFWPTSVPVTAANMNWSCLLWGATMIFAGCFWVMHGRGVYKGPIMETGIMDAVV